MDALNDVNDVPEPIAGALRALDDQAAQAAARVDPERTAERVLARLREEPAVAVRPPSGVGRASLRIAAAFALLVIGAGVARRLVRQPGPQDAAARLAAAALGSDSLSTDQARQVLAAVEESRGAPFDSVVTVASAVSMDDLTESELQTLLTSMQREENAR